MEALTSIATLVGIGAGIVAILQWLFGIIPKRLNYKKIYEKEFKVWIDSNHSYLMKEESFKTLIGYLLNNRLSPERETFALLNANHYGDKSLEKFIVKNENNEYAIPFIFDSVSGKGTRVGWRAEYILTRLDKQKVISYIDKLPGSFKENSYIKQSIQRIVSDEVEQFLYQQLNSDNQKLKAYAHEVLIQINARPAPETGN